MEKIRSEYVVCILSLMLKLTFQELHCGECETKALIVYNIPKVCLTSPCTIVTLSRKWAESNIGV